MSDRLKHSDGFMMVEMAIALIILSVCWGGMLALLQQARLAAQEANSRDRVLMINKVLNRFHREEGYVPCPSSPEAFNGDALVRCSGAVQQIGLVPYKTLGIPAEYAKDGQGSFFTYAVSEGATMKRNLLDSTITTEFLDIVDKFHAPFNGGKEGFAYLLISHGKRGAGAFLGSRGRSRKVTNTDFDRINSLDTLTFVVTTSPKDSEQKIFFIQRSDLDIESKQLPIQENTSLEILATDPYETWSE